MINNKEIKKKAVKYFIQRKLVEIFILLLIIFIPYFLGFYIGDNNDTMCCEDISEYNPCDCCIPLIWLEGICYILFFAAVITILAIIIIKLIQEYQIFIKKF